MKWTASIILSLALLTGCGGFPLSGGRAEFQSPSGAAGAVQQPQNPKQESSQVWEREQRPDGSVQERVSTKIGAAQKDNTREIGAKLASLKWVVWVGIAVFLFGVASMFWPPLKVVVASQTTSLMLAAAGIALIVLPSLIVGNELLILAVALGAVGIYWFSHRHGRLQGFVDANKDGIDDRKQKPL